MSVEWVKNMPIKNNLTNIDYFGIEILVVESQWFCLTKDKHKLS